MDFIVQYPHYIDAKKNLHLTFFCILNMNILKENVIFSIKHKLLNR